MFFTEKGPTQKKRKEHHMVSKKQTIDILGSDDSSDNYKHKKHFKKVAALSNYEKDSSSESAEDQDDSDLDSSNQEENLLEADQKSSSDDTEKTSSTDESEVEYDSATDEDEGNEELDEENDELDEENEELDEENEELDEENEELDEENDELDEENDELDEDDDDQDGDDDEQDEDDENQDEDDDEQDGDDDEQDEDDENQDEDDEDEEYDDDSLLNEDEQNGEEDEEAPKDGLLIDSLAFEGEDMKVLKKKIGQIVAILQDWKTHKHLVQMSRPELIQKLISNVCIYYGYTEELAQYFISLLGPVNAIKFFEASESQRPVTLRTNLLTTTRPILANALISRGCRVINFDDWTKVGLAVKESTVPIGATPEYCAGNYMIQSASSFLPVLALDPKPGETILDMTAAPGGKSTYIGQLMQNSGVLFCNDVNKERLPALVANIHRMGVTNTIVTHFSGLELAGKLPLLDRVLLDAPCTGLGVISRDSSVKVKRSVEDIRKQSELQKKLILAAIDLVDANSKAGIIVYSTCSLSVEENEEVIEFALNNRHIKVIPLEVDVGEPGITSFQGKVFSPQLKKARRVYPHLLDMDGFFYCKIKKLSNKIQQRQKKDRSKHNPYVKNWGKEHWNTTYLDKPLSTKFLSKKATAKIE